MRVLELNHAAAIDAEQMVVRRLVVEVRIVGRLVLAEIDFAQQARLHQQPEGAVNSGAGGIGIQLAGAGEELIRGEMLVLGKGGLDDGFALTGPAEALALDEVIEPFLDAGVHPAISSDRPPLGEVETQAARPTQDFDNREIEFTRQLQPREKTR